MTHHNSLRSQLNLLTVALLVSLVSPAMGDSPKSSTDKLPEGYVEEAPLPEGFPAPSEPGKVVEKEYPLTRSYSATGRDAFMKCFRYLTKKDHKMTAPVVIEPKKSQEEKADDQDDYFNNVDRMHFLLEKVSLDEPQQLELVEVADMPKMRVLSIAHQGELTPDAFKKAEEKLKDELESRSDLTPAGETRILGYNSPMLAQDKQFWEVQLPVKAKE